jgi:hypothetical protein
MLAARATPKYEAAAYKGLSKQSVAVMVWPDRGVQMDHPYVQGDVAAGIQKKLIDVQGSDKPAELQDAKFPFRTDAILAYQEEHPETQTQPLTEMAAKLNVSRLIYVEVTDFSTRSPISEELYLGTMVGNVKVVEIDDKGSAKTVYEKNEIKVAFPKDSPKEGMPSGTDAKIYQGTLDMFTTQVAQLMYTHEVDED